MCPRPFFFAASTSHSRKSVEFIAKATAKGAHMLSNLMFAPFFGGISEFGKTYFSLASAHVSLNVIYLEIRTDSASFIQLNLRANIN